VCTARSSVALKEVVGLALVDDELAGEGTCLAIYEDGCRGQLIYAKVVKKPFYDPEGERLRS
jgi:glycine cleavage system aminomethyltransferase T